ncbi:MAG: hypothetical protein ACKPKT_06300 [Dolichospermum sp.]
MMIEKILQTEILVVSGISSNEINDLIKKYENCNNALNSLIKGIMSLDDYIDFLLMAGIDIDDFLDEANDDAILMGI